MFPAAAASDNALYVSYRLVEAGREDRENGASAARQFLCSLGLPGLILPSARVVSESCCWAPSVSGRPCGANEWLRQQLPWGTHRMWRAAWSTGKRPRPMPLEREASFRTTEAEKNESAVLG